MRGPRPSRVAAVLIAYAILVTAYCLVANSLPVVVRDAGRLYGLVAAACIFGAWGLIMSRSWREYRRARDGGGDPDLRLHIWLISTAFLGYVLAACVRTIELIGQDFQVEAAPTMIYFGPMALYALWLFIRPGYQENISPDDRTATTPNESA